VVERNTSPTAIWISSASVADRREARGSNNSVMSGAGNRAPATRTRSQIRAGWG
jgi:hypothetical protein